MTNVAKPLPRDGRLISLILAAKGVEDADERVIHQLLEFAHRYTADVLQSAQFLADHASRSGPGKVEKEDVELAIQMRRRHEFFEAPPRDYLAALAHELNSQPLPILPESFEVVRLPPPHQRLAQVNFDLIPDEDLNLDDFSEDEEDEDEEQDDADEPAEEKYEDDPEEEDMEEVAVEPQRQERDIDEDYDS